MTRKNMQFWWVTAAAVVTMAVTAALGVWQVGRAAEKQALQTAIDTQGALPPLTNAEVIDGDARAIHRTAVVRGQWLGAQTVFLDNRQMDGRVGLYVLTPLQLEGSRKVLMVQRGWAPRNFLDRTRLPEVPTPEGSVSLTVRLAPPPSRLFEFAGGDNGRLRQNIDLSAYAAEKQIDLLTRLSGVESDAAADGLLRHWPAFNLGIDRHHGYAFQWFGLSLLVLLLYVWFQFIQPSRSRRAS